MNDDDDKHDEVNDDDDDNHYDDDDDSDDNDDDDDEDAPIYRYNKTVQASAGISALPQFCPCHSPPSFIMVMIMIMMIMMIMMVMMMRRRYCKSSLKACKLVYILHFSNI